MYCTLVGLGCDSSHSEFGVLIHRQMLASDNICEKGDSQVPAENKGPHQVLTEFIEDTSLTDCYRWV